jgi:cell division protein ZapA (FtsZ GTPase activity inhibitor)
MPERDQYIQFEVLGERFVIRSDVDREYFLGLVSHLERAIEEVQERFPKLSPLKTAILSAVNILDEMAKQKKNILNESDVELIQNLSQSLASAVDSEEGER